MDFKTELAAEMKYTLPIEDLPKSSFFAFSSSLQSIMAQKCAHKGCGKTFTDPGEDCVYHPGPPIFHEGQKGVCAPYLYSFNEAHQR